jgi:hypothetical protein
MHLIVYRTVFAETVRAEDLLEYGDGQKLVVEEVRLRRDDVRIGGSRVGSESSRLSWVTFKHGEQVKILAVPEDVEAVMGALHNALGYATEEWNDRQDPDERGGVSVPPWRRFDNGPFIDLDVSGRWFTVAPHYLEPSEPQHVEDPDDEDPGQTDPDA